MFRFRLGSIPVEVQASHLITSAVLGLSFAPAGRPGLIGSMGFQVVSWMFIVFVSVLIHELGHAVASKAFGYQPSITLEWMGGHTRPNAPGPIPWSRDVLLTLAGPLFGLGLGIACYVGKRSLGHQSDVLAYLLGVGALANFFWAGLNMAPVLPLDGGRITSVLAMRLFGRERGFLWAQILAVITSVGLVLWSIDNRQMFLAVFFAMFGFQALRAAYDAMKGPEQESREQSPQANTLQRAQAALAKNQLEEARHLAATVLDSGEALTPDLASRAHHTLGWVALKKGQGRMALDHFSQVQGQPVEPQALAAAFSLIGDEGRALPLWEMAWRDSGDRTVMHEYAGSLIRAGKEPQALRLPQVDPAAAFSCAERVLFIRGAFSEAAAMGERALAYAPSATIAYDAACAFARAHNIPDAVRLLQRAKELGFRDGTYAASDEDLAPLHGNPGFEAWLTELRQSAPS
ncbi:TPR end-of-group domain-containing protein [Hyalangium minutum]|uniref:Peptidase, M50 family protein n=1 Tax=Hyalangium minutum TaxID=394096 RepID=A0A085VYU2_9BACT|nr:peptidase M50 [Hyalangium minutum]KFE60605.1 peptidase, M50 family protein [Hyalangium minutum]